MAQARDGQNDMHNGRLAFAGVLGGVLYSLSDDLIFLGASPLGPTPDPAWAGMPIWRFVLSAWVALVATSLLACGYVSLYRMVKDTCSDAVRRISLCGAVGLGGALLAHFCIGVLEPLVFKALTEAGVSQAVFVQVSSYMTPLLRPLNIAVIILLYSQLAVLVYGVVSWRFGLTGQVLLLALGLALGITAAKVLVLRLFGVSGGIGGAESLFEGMFYLVPLAYWSGEAEAARPSRNPGSQRRQRRGR